MTKRDRHTWLPKRIDEEYGLIAGEYGFLVTYDVAFALTLDYLGPPTKYSEIFRRYDEKAWLEAVNSEMASLLENHTWEVVDRREAHNVISNK